MHFIVNYWGLRLTLCYVTHYINRTVNCNLLLFLSKASITHDNIFHHRPSPLIHASSQHHFTHPLRNPPTFNSEEEFIRPSSNLSPTGPKFIRQSSNNPSSNNHFNGQNNIIHPPKSQFIRQTGALEDTSSIQFKRPSSSARDNSIPHTRLSHRYLIEGDTASET